MKKIAITGGIGSGKTTLLEILKRKGYPVFSCDEIYKEVIREAEYIEKVAALFPDCVQNGVISKEKLAKIVFSDAEKRAKLNAVAHPMIMQRLLSSMEKLDNAIVFAEVPLLFEGGYEDLFDHILVIKRDKEERLKAVEKRDGITIQKAQDRINAQFDYDTTSANLKFSACNAIVITNDKTQKDLEKIIADLIKEIS